jgi:creatinine amidohydrolase/Fe(II)-dependent formamide hydrolase-like protein
VLIAFLLMATPVLAAEQAQATGQRGQRGQRGGRGEQNLTPEQREQQERQRAARELADGVRPIEMLDTVWIEEQSWMETRDSIAAGKTIAIVGSGGLEKNGPYNANGKHNFVLRSTCDAIARKLGNALCAPIVPMEPGNIDNPNITPGSVFITQETFRAVLRDMATSLKSMGFKDIIFIADSGGNVNGMTEVAKELNSKWNGNPARVHYVTEYYTEDIWSFDYLKKIGIQQQPDVRSATRWDIHDDYHYESLVALTNPKLIRAEQRIKAGKFVINQVEIGSVQKMLENGRKLLEYRADISANAIKKAIANWKPSQQ